MSDLHNSEKADRQDRRNELKLASINVLELFVVVHMIWSNLDLLQGTVVHTKCDNQSAVTWINRMRGSSQSETSIALLRLLTCITHTFNITLTSSHISGVDNVEPDDLSRLITLFEQDAIPMESGWLTDRIKVEKWQAGNLTRISRVSLALVLNKPEELRGARLLSAINASSGALGRVPVHG
jgi:hypothetical protein